MVNESSHSALFRLFGSKVFPRRQSVSNFPLITALHADGSFEFVLVLNALARCHLGRPALNRFLTPFSRLILLQ